jgi:hypothetical protein
MNFHGISPYKIFMKIADLSTVYKLGHSGRMSLTDNIHCTKMVVSSMRLVSPKGNISKDSLKNIYGRKVGRVVG